MSTFKIIHQRENCIGCNSCVNIAPQNWVMDQSDGKSSLIGGLRKGNVFIAECFACDLDVNEMAVNACPMNIIKIVK